MRDVDPAEFELFDMRIEFPTLILRQSLAMNMFHHAAISKRVHYYATKAAMPALNRFITILNLAEAEAFPLHSHFNKRAISALLPRWREGVLYTQMLFDLARGYDAVALEEKYLKAA